MEPRKSKALIITFIIVLTLLIVGYFVIIRGGLIKSDSAIGKKFAPLLGTPKKKDVIVTETTPPNEGQTPAETETPTDQNPIPTDEGSTQGNDGGISRPKYVPPNQSLPTPNYETPKPKNYTATTECSDGKDNDKDGSIDSADNDCHSDGNAKNNATYMPTYSKELGSTNIPEAPVDGKKVISCDVEQVPLVFTPEEQAELDKLTREFYRLAPQLKTENDISIELTSYNSYLDTINNAKNLTKQCRDQTSQSSYLVNNIDKEVQPVGKKTLFSYWEQDDGTSMPRGEDCLSMPYLCHQVFQDYQVQSVIISTLNKGRTERVRTPFYDSSKEIYPFKETGSFFLQYFPDPRTTSKGRSTNTPGATPLLWDWNDWEKATQVW